MNKQFDKYLAMLESAAPADRKADFRAARELYRKKARMEANDLGLGGSQGSSPSLSTFGKHDSKGAARSEDMKAKADSEARDFRDAQENFPSATKSIETLAKHQPGKVDAWVDARLEPAIRRTLETDDGFLTRDDKKAGYETEKKEWTARFREEDEAEKKRLDDELKYSKEKLDFEKGEADEIAGLEKFDDAAEKRAAAGTDLKYDKFDATMPLNAPKEDVNGIVAEKKHEQLVKNQDADDKFRSASRFWDKQGMSEETSPRISEDEGNRNAAAQKATIKGDDGSEINADDIDVEKLFSGFESVSTGKLRAAFESVYGDSKGFSDQEIRTICESCYRRTRK